MNIYPAILTGSLAVATEQLAIVENQPKVAVTHVDIIDGFFADNLTITPIDLAELDLGELQLDLHLMTTEPLDFVYEAVAALEPATIRAMIGQVEQMSWQSEFIAEVKKHGWKTGLALNLYTPIEEIDDESWTELDMIQLMAIEAGEQGKEFNPLILNKIAEVQAKIKEINRPIEIIVDGGIKEQQLAQLAKAHVDSAAIGSAIWSDADPATKLTELLNAV